MLASIEKHLLILFVLAIHALYAFSQDVPFSQHYSNLVYLNPAFAGTQDGQRVNMFYRNQWPVSAAGFQSFGVAFDMPIQSYNSGIGIIVSNDLAGAYVEPSIDFIYSYQIQPFKNAFLSMALQGGVVQKYLNTSSLDFRDKNEVIGGGFSKIIPDFALGISAFYNNYYGGISADHLLVPYQGVKRLEDQRINRKYTFFVGYLYDLDGRLIKAKRILSPNILVQIQGAQQNINWGSSFQYNWLIGGLWIRHNLYMNFDSAILMAGFKTQDMRFAYSYDMNLGKKTFNPLGSHEVSFTMLFEYHKKKSYKVVKCPSFLL